MNRIGESLRKARRTLAGTGNPAGGKGRVIVQTHRLKTWPDAFDAVVRGAKKAEFRKDDRGFQVGDELLLERWNPDTEEYTGDVVRVEITHILRGPVFGIPEGYAMLSVECGLYSWKALERVTG